MAANNKTLFIGQSKDFPKDITCKDFDLCFYHKYCPDGTGGAYPFWRENKDIVFIGSKHGDHVDLELIKGKRIIVVDFSWKYDVILDICKYAKFLLILDHHDCAVKEIAGKGLEDKVENISYILNMEKSGAQIAWDWVYKSKSRPWFIDYIADRDLWKWKLPDSKAISAAMYDGGWYTWENMDVMLTRKNTFLPLFKIQGSLILKQNDKEINNVVKFSKLVNFSGYKVRIAQCRAAIRSDVGNRLCNIKDSNNETCEFAAVYRYIFDDDQWSVSLRSLKTCSINLSDVASKFGGGGHPCAAGFTIHGSNSKDYFKFGIAKDSPRTIFSEIQ